MTTLNETSGVVESKRGWPWLRLVLTLLCLALVGVSLAAAFMVLENQNRLAKGQVEIQSFRSQAASREMQTADQYRLLDEQKTAMDRMRTEQRDLDQRKRDRDAVIAERDEGVRAKHEAEVARDKALADVRSAGTDLTFARDALASTQAETTRLAALRSNTQAELDRLQRDRPAAESALRKANDDRMAAETQTQAAAQARDDARRVAETARRDRDAAVEAATQAKTEQAGLAARMAETTNAVQRAEARRQQATAEADADEARGKKAADALGQAQAAQQAFLAVAPQREAELTRRLQASQAAAAQAETNRVTKQQELDGVLAQLTAARSDQARLQNGQASLQAAQQALSGAQQQQAQLQAQLAAFQKTLEEQRVGTAKALGEQAKAQTARDALQAELTMLGSARDAMRQELGQRDQIGRELEALNRTVGERRAEANAARDAADQARAERVRVLAEQSALERQRAELVAALPDLTAQRDALRKERDDDVAQAAGAGVALSRAVRAREDVEQEVVRLRGFAATLASSSQTEAKVEPPAAPVGAK